MVDRALRPQIFEIEPSHPNAEKKYRHWKTTLQNYLTTLPAPVHAAGATPDAIAQATLAHNQKKFYALVNNVSAEVYELVSERINYRSPPSFSSLVYSQEVVSNITRSSLEYYQG